VLKLKEIVFIVLRKNLMVIECLRFIT